MIGRLEELYLVVFSPHFCIEEAENCSCRRNWLAESVQESWIKFQQNNDIFLVSCDLIGMCINQVHQELVKLVVYIKLKI